MTKEKQDIYAELSGSKPNMRFAEFHDKWEKCFFSQIALKIQDGTHFSPKPNENGKYLYLTSKNIKNGYIDLSKVDFILQEAHEKIYKRCDVKYGDVLVTKDGTIGQVCVNDLSEPFSLLSSVAFIRVNHENNNHFLCQLIASPIGQNEIRKSIAGQALKRITLTKLNGFRQFFPSLPEQQKIANFLTAVDDKIQQLTKKKKLLEQYKKGVMQKIFSQEIRFKDDDGNDYPDWEEKKLGELIIKMQSGISRLLNDSDIGLPVIRSNNLTNDRLNVNDIKYWYIEDNQGVNLENYILRDGDLLVNFINSIAQIGKIALFEDLLGRDTIFTTNLMRLSFMEGINEYYMFYYFCTSTYNKHIQSITKPAVNQASFTTKDFQRLNVSLPCKTEQQKIADFLSSIDKKIESVNAQVEKTKEFKKGLLQQMFV